MNGYAVLVFAGQNAARERTPRHGAEANARVHVRQTELDLVALEHVVLGLFAYWRDQIELTCHRIGFLNHFIRYNLYIVILE